MNDGWSLQYCYIRPSSTEHNSSDDMGIIA